MTFMTPSLKYDVIRIIAFYIPGTYAQHELPLHCNLTFNALFATLNWWRGGGKKCLPHTCTCSHSGMQHQSKKNTSLIYFINILITAQT